MTPRYGLVRSGSSAWQGATGEAEAAPASLPVPDATESE